MIPRTLASTLIIIGIVQKILSDVVLVPSLLLEALEVIVLEANSEKIDWNANMKLPIQKNFKGMQILSRKNKTGSLELPSCVHFTFTLF